MGNYDDKNTVITGGGNGIGFAMAKLLVDGGARVVITGRSQATLDAARERLGKNATTVRGDVASMSDLDALADRVKSDLGTIDALFVNAGIAPLANLIGIPEASVYAPAKRHCARWPAAFPVSCFRAESGSTR